VACFPWLEEMFFEVLIQVTIGIEKSFSISVLIAAVSFVVPTHRWDKHRMDACRYWSLKTK
jgi:hypothetical protein